MYPVEEVLGNLADSLGFLLAAGGVAFIGYYLYYGEAIRLGFRDRTHGVPVFANMYNFAHDVLFVSYFRRWFFEVEHWLFKLFWVALLIFVLLELVMHYQTIRFSREELMPGASMSQFMTAYVLAQIGIGVLFYFIYSQIDDFLFLVSFASAVIVSVAVMPSFLNARRSRKGQSLVVAGSLIVAPAGFFFLFLPAAATYFQSLPYYLVGAATVIAAILYLWLLSRQPRFTPA